MNPSMPSALERRWKTHVKAQIHDGYVVVTPGFATAAAAEVAAMGIEITALEEGGVAFKGKLEDFWRVNATSRTATRVLMRLASFRALRFERLREIIKKLPFELYFLPEHKIKVKVTSTKSKLWHEEAVAESVEQAFAARMREYYPYGAPNSGAEHVLYVRLFEDQVTLSLDTTGAALYRRGYDKWIAEAPLRDTLAAALLQIKGLGEWDCIADYCCGSGTLLLEHALATHRVLPGRLRTFAFADWVGFRPAAYANALKKWELEIPEVKAPKYVFGDRDPRALEIAKRNWRAAGMDEESGVEFHKVDALKAHAPRGAVKGLVIGNLPYGERLSLPKNAYGFFEKLGHNLRHNWKGWEYLMLLPQGEATQTLGMRHDLVIEFSNGGIPVAAVMGKVNSD